ncbi:MAG: serine/threonine protein kinase [Proteobacteria bacterium]|nr:serine/threonine protein kinase [Pseudomonadota bacterium]
MNAQRLGHYLLLKRLGIGSMAETWLAARQISTDVIKFVALKCILSAYNAIPDYIRLFYREAAISLALDHANIVNVWDCDIIEGRNVMIMEFMDGVTLDALLKRAPNQQLTPEIASYIALEILQGLSYLHSIPQRDGTQLHVIHRDINPQNIFIYFDGRCKLFDFGVARTDSEDIDIQHGMLVGKPPYMSPEQCYGNNVDARSDLFSLAAVLYEMTMGHSAFGCDNDIKTINAVMTRNPVSPSAHNINFPSFLSRIIMRGLEKNPNHRYADAGAFIQDLTMFRKVTGNSGGQSLLQGWMSALFAEEISQSRSYLTQVTHELAQSAPTIDDLIASSRMLDSFAGTDGSLQITMSKLSS